MEFVPLKAEVKKSNKQIKKKGQNNSLGKEKLANRKNDKVQKKSKVNSPSGLKKKMGEKKSLIVIEKTVKNKPKSTEEPNLKDGGKNSKLSEKINKLKKKREGMNNRLIIFGRKSHINEAEAKKLHPDIVQIKFPRNKARWCWAVFKTEKEALAAFEALRNNKEYRIKKARTDVDEKEFVRKNQSRLQKKLLRQELKKIITKQKEQVK